LSVDQPIGAIREVSDPNHGDPGVGCALDPRKHLGSRGVDAFDQKGLK
jgi:hypothetical protein